MNGQRWRTGSSQSNALSLQTRVHQFQNLVDEPVDRPCRRHEVTGSSVIDDLIDDAVQPSGLVQNDVEVGSFFVGWIDLIPQKRRS